MPTPRERARERTLADITRIGREQLVAQGAEGLSLRAVARELGVVSSAIYRYVRNRDELLTLLVVDAYTELADEVDAAVDSVPASDHGERLAALCHACRAWALREPARYALLYGTPVSDYHAPADRTTGPGTRVIVSLAGIVLAAYEAGALEAPDTVVPQPLCGDLDAIRAQLTTSAPDGLLCRTMFAWSALFGAISFEVFGQYGRGTFTDAGLLFEQQIATLSRTLGLPPGAARTVPARAR